MTVYQVEVSKTEDSKHSFDYFSTAKKAEEFCDKHFKIYNFNRWYGMKSTYVLTQNTLCEGYNAVWVDSNDTVYVIIREIEVH